MAVEVIANMNGSCTQQLGPDSRPRRVRAGERIEWLWPVDGNADDEGYVPLPKGWTVLRTIGKEELERRLKKHEQPEDTQRRRGTEDVEKSKVVPVQRGYNDEDRALIARAVESLDDDDHDHWTKQGKAEMQAIRERFEKLDMEKTGARDWPSWLTREIVDSVGARKRGDLNNDL